MKTKEMKVEIKVNNLSTINDIFSNNKEKQLIPGTSVEVKSEKIESENQLLGSAILITILFLFPKLI
jgi:hypothetical protein